ncbi:MAG TPA: DMT family transporter [Terriglobales bacterium]|nr:DMT family transporter [Terriglobales bacterium]
MKYKNELLLMMVTFLWGHGTLATKFINTGFDPMPGLTLRYLAALVVIGGFTAHTLRKDPQRKKTFITKTTLRVVGVTGTFSVASLTLQMIALRYTTASNTSFILCTYTVIMPCLAALIFREPIHKVQIWGLFSCFLGTALISRVIGFEGGFHIGLDGLGVGDLLMLVCSLLVAVQSLAVSRLGKAKVDPLGFVLSQIAYCFLACALGWALIFQGARADFGNLPALLGVCYNGALGSGAVYIVYSSVMPRMAPATAGLILACEPVFTTFAASVIPIAGKTEPIGLIQVTGGALILGTVVAVQRVMNKGAASAVAAADSAKAG